jgi:hypothetical protein
MIRWSQVEDETGEKFPSGSSGIHISDLDRFVALVEDLF